LKIGSIAGITIRKVVAPEPSRCATTEMIAVIIKTAVTLLPAKFTRGFTILSNIPASDIVPKYVTEKINSTAVFQVVATPLLINSAISLMLKPANRAATTGKRTKRTAGTVFSLNKRIIITKIMTKPINANIRLLLLHDL